MSSIFIKLEKYTYVPGEQVNGFIYLNLSASLNGSEVLLSVSGVEEVKLVESRLMNHYEYNSRWRDHQLRHNIYSHTKYNWEPVHNAWEIGNRNAISGDSGEMRNVLIDHYSTNEIFHHHFPIFKWNGGLIPPGQWSFPFSFTLPQGIPASFNYQFNEHGRICFGDITYNLMAYVPNTGVFGFFQSNLKQKTYFIVNHPTKSESGQTSDSKTLDVTSCCCIDKGKATISAYFEKINYTPGETAYIISEVDASKLKTDVLEVDGYFRQVLKLTTNSFTKIINHKLQVVKMPGVKKGQKKIGNDAIRTPIQLVDNSSRNAVQPTSQGNLVNNSYTLESRAKVDASVCCDSHPTIKLSANVFNIPVEPPIWSTPSSWNPQIMDNYVANFTSEFNSGSSFAHYPQAKYAVSGAEMNYPQSPGVAIPYPLTAQTLAPGGGNMGYPQNAQGVSGSSTNYPSNPGA